MASRVDDGRAGQVLHLEAKVQHYPWGDLEFIPSLLGIENSDALPYAELWVGAHPDLPSEARTSQGRSLPLDELIAAAPEEVLGPDDASRFGGELPYLFKVLAARKPLSIQTHPSADRARQGFARENAAGIPREAPHRSYKDPRPKPELIAALTDFYALRGFRPLTEIRELSQIPGSGEVTSAADLKALYRRLMQAGEGEAESLLSPLLEDLARRNEERAFQKNEREYWLLRAEQEFGRDRGLFSIYLLNLIRLVPGESLFLPAGVLHAYLEGAGIEIMANSNNVLRGGLTRKHVDIPELLANVTFEGARPEILQPRPASDPRESVYPTGAEEFELRRLRLSPGDLYHRLDTRGAEIALVVEASSPLTLATATETLPLRRGEAFLAPHRVSYRIESRGAAELFKATVPPEATSEAASSSATFPAGSG